MAHRPDPDRILFAQIAAVAGRHARDQELTPEEEAEAVSELRQLACGRSDLLAERAGTALGYGEAQLDADRYRQIARLCLAAGADQSMVPEWMLVGRSRAERAAALPNTGGRHRG